MGKGNDGVATACILVVGDEILSGRTKDKNIGTIADFLNDLGIDLQEVRIVRDVESAIIEAVNVLRARVSYLFTTGGIGPTHDDITADSIAKAFKVSIDIDPRAVAMMRECYDEKDLTPARLRMARIPKGADLITNPLTKAPGFHIENVFVMAGVPIIMQTMLESIRPKLSGGQKIFSYSIDNQLPEGVVAAPLQALQASFPDVSMGSYPYVKDGRFGTSLVLRSRNQKRLDTAYQKLKQIIQDLQKQERNKV